MPIKGQTLTEEQKKKLRNYNEWKTTPKGIEYFENLKKEKQKIIDKYNENPTLCIQCKNKIEFCEHYKDKKFCSRSCSAKYSNAHREPMTEEQKIKISLTMKEKVKNGTYIYPQFKSTIFTKIRFENICKICNSKFEVSTYYKNKIYCSKSCYLNDPNKKHGIGGHRHGSGRGKKGWYKGYFCDSSWELAYVIYSIDHNIIFTRNTTKFEYIWQNQTHYWIPDFILEHDNSYVEVKGYFTEQVKAKLSSFTHPIQVIDKHKIKPILDYVTAKYGKNFIELYENNPYYNKNNTCSVCSNPCVNIYCSRSCCGKATAYKKHNKHL